MSPAVRENLPHDLNLEYHDHAVAGVNDFPRKRKIHDSRHSRRDASRDRVGRVIGIGRGHFELAFLVELVGPRLQWGISLGENVPMILAFKPNP
jgi:hypothetical protein